MKKIADPDLYYQLQASKNRKGLFITLYKATSVLDESKKTLIETKRLLYKTVNTDVYPLPDVIGVMPYHANMNAIFAVMAVPCVTNYSKCNICSSRNKCFNSVVERLRRRASRFYDRDVTDHELLYNDELKTGETKRFWQGAKAGFFVKRDDYYQPVVTMVKDVIKSWGEVS